MTTGARHGARRLLVQALYQHQISASDASALRDQFTQSTDFEHADGDYFFALLDEIVKDPAVLDERIDTFADRPVSQIDPVERAILWIGVAELRSHPEVPPKVVINEAVELAKEFGAEDSHRYVNAILDGAAKDPG
ncbi:MAG: transcription antitermination factor NusB [Gammaproteobacteria bacterium]|nr:transcription antitermination factor NusB [Gammaproteobacteria bacterium]NND36693.1 transcription antitermination factor NusB [Gammaproteobacteria bacterium]